MAQHQHKDGKWTVIVFYTPTSTCLAEVKGPGNTQASNVNASEIARVVDASIKNSLSGFENAVKTLDVKIKEAVKDSFASFKDEIKAEIDTQFKAIEDRIHTLEQSSGMAKDNNTLEDLVITEVATLKKTLEEQFENRVKAMIAEDYSCDASVTVTGECHGIIDISGTPLRLVNSSISSVSICDSTSEVGSPKYTETESYVSARSDTRNYELISDTIFFKSCDSGSSKANDNNTVIEGLMYGGVVGALSPQATNTATGSQNAEAASTQREGLNRSGQLYYKYEHTLKKGVKISRTTAIIEGDLTIGALFALHDPPAQSNGYGRKCGSIREQYGIQRTEATFKAIDAINNDPKLLPNVTLGVEIRDTCWYTSFALGQSLQFIKDEIPLAHHDLIQIGYSATSRTLSDKRQYGYFLRVVPSDDYQAQVMLDIVKYFNWTYISIVNTDVNYGQKGIDVFRELAEGNKICIAEEENIAFHADNEAYDEVIRKLLEEPNARVIVCFCQGSTVRGLLKAQRRLKVKQNFFFLG
ncbi:hypothetical protein QYM36_010670, partial [Artemia franciscana]